ncbi:MAG: extracellular solute-binding protein [Desulfocapsa sp.]|nr:extracellular solute-binding protein [Desulfocapsa sp.]MBN4048956.1 extracellular solute-binding protein [bacterium AH-315-N22]MBN4063933.1 extracellular solute-binding protein [bacterium AH-315-I07]
MKKMSALLAASILFSGVWASMTQAAEVSVYSARKEHLIKPLFDAYTAKTGVKINYTTGKAGMLLEKLKAEGEHPAADLLITVDAGNLWHAADTGIFEPVDSKILAANIPAHLRDPENRWFGFSVRARTIIYNKNKVNPEQLSTYEDLADPKWKGKLALRTSKKVYNQSLVAAMIAEHGEEKAEEIVRGWVKNLAAAPYAKDSKALEALVAGVADVTLVNTYYYGRMMKKNPDLPLVIFWPNQETTGVHVNVSGGGLIKGAKNKEEAIKLLEWFSGIEAQGLFAGSNMEYPANPAVKPSEFVASWGDFKADPIGTAKYGEFQEAAVKLMDRARYK